MSATYGFRAIRVRFDLDTDASEADVATLLRLTERYCVVLQTIAGTPNSVLRLPSHNNERPLQRSTL